MNLMDIVSTLVVATLCYIWRDQIALALEYLVDVAGEMLQERVRVAVQDSLQRTGDVPVVVDETEHPSPVETLLMKHPPAVEFVMIVVITLSFLFSYHLLLSHIFTTQPTHCYPGRGGGIYNKIQLSCPLSNLLLLTPPSFQSSGRLPAAPQQSCLKDEVQETFGRDPRVSQHYCCFIVSIRYHIFLINYS